MQLKLIAFVGNRAYLWYSEAHWTNRWVGVLTTELKMIMVASKFAHGQKNVKDFQWVNLQLKSFYESLPNYLIFCLQVIPTSKWIPSNKTKRHDASKTDLFAVECHLPEPPINLGNFDVEGSPAAGYMISVSNDKVHKSQEALKLIIFDSVCQECNISHGCSLKVNWNLFSSAP